MELLLWRWSTTAQIASALTLAVFFAVLGRSMRRVGLRPWVAAWLANLVAMLVTTIFWLVQPSSAVAFVALRAGYLGAKTMFVLLLAVGAWTFARRPPSARLMRTMAFAVAGLAIVMAFVLDTIDKIGVAQSGVTGVFLAAAALVLVRRHARAWGWLAAGFAIRALLAIVESLAYATRVWPRPWSSHDAIGVFLASHSSFDTGAEWVIALGCVLTLYRTIQEELTRSNADLLAAKETLQELVDRDSLTGLANRRALPAALEQSFDTGATILFFDLNDFKMINDSYGHQAGDECLRAFATALQESFRADDHVFRYAGDEFVVIARGVEPEQIAKCVETVRERLRFERSSGPQVRFSVGQAYLPAQGEPDAALRAADEAMYRDKARQTRRMRSI